MKVRIVELGRASTVTASFFLGKLCEANNPILYDYVN